MPAVNVVEVEPRDLDREADNVLRGAPPDSAPGAEPGGAPRDDGSANAEQSGGSWAEITPGLVTLATIVVLPQWGITQEEAGHVSKALADVLEQVFPGGMGNSKWAPWIRLAMVSTGVVLARFDAEVGFPPIGPRRPKPVGPSSEASSSSSSSSSNAPIA